MTQIETAIASFWAAIVRFLLGWLVAYGVVSSECDKLGGFYVNDTVYECRQKKAPTL